MSPRALVVTDSELEYTRLAPVASRAKTRTWCRPSGTLAGLNCSVVDTVSGQGTRRTYGVRQIELETGTSLTVRPSTCTPVEATPPPVSLNVVAMLCTPLTGPPAPNMA